MSYDKIMEDMIEKAKKDSEGLLELELRKEDSSSVFRGTARYHAGGYPTVVDFRLEFEGHRVRAYSGRKKKSRKVLRNLPLLMEGYSMEEDIQRAETGMMAVYSRDGNAGPRTSLTFGHYPGLSDKGWGV